MMKVNKGRYLSRGASVEACINVIGAILLAFIVGASLGIHLTSEGRDRAFEFGYSKGRDGVSLLQAQEDWKKIREVKD